VGTKEEKLQFAAAVHIRSIYKPHDKMPDQHRQLGDGDRYIGSDWNNPQSYMGR
jgi:hypothetical protein